MRFYSKKKILITGVTGFKGAWLALILKLFGAQVFGIGIKKKEYKFFNFLKLSSKIRFYNLNINNYKKLKEIIEKVQPDIIFHLASESLVVRCNFFPKKAITTNILGLTNLFLVLKDLDIKKKIIINVVTSDKCYEPNDKKSYTEDDSLGGFDVYSATKSCQEILSRSFYQSYFKEKKNYFFVTLRAGNVIGGGDYSPYRLLPDIIRSLNNKTRLNIRNLFATRPWQHIYDCLNGYLLACRYCFSHNINYSSWNFGPKKKSIKVLDILKILIRKNFIKKSNVLINKNLVNESINLSLNSNKARRFLKWKTKFSYNQAITETFQVYNLIKNFSYNILLYKEINKRLYNYFFTRK